MQDIPKDTLEDACQLVKANSIQVGPGSCGGLGASLTLPQANAVLL